MSLSWAILNVAIAVILFAFVFKTIGRVLPILPVVVCRKASNCFNSFFLILSQFFQEGKKVQRRLDEEALFSQQAATTGQVQSILS